MFADSEVTVRAPKVLTWLQPVEPPAQLTGSCEAKDGSTRRSIGSAEEAEDEHEDAHWLESDSNCNSDEETEEADVEETGQKLEEKKCCRNCSKHAQSRHAEDKSDEEEEDDSDSGQSTEDDDDCLMQDTILHRNTAANNVVPRLAIPEMSFDDVPWETCSIGHLSDGSFEEAGARHNSYVYEPLSMREDDEESECSERCGSLKVETTGGVDQVEDASAVTYEEGNEEQVEDDEAVTCSEDNVEEVEDDESVTLEDGDVEEAPTWLIAELVRIQDVVNSIVEGAVQADTEICKEFSRNSREEAILEFAAEGETTLMEGAMQADTENCKESTGGSCEAAILELATEGETTLMEDVAQADTTGCNLNPPAEITPELAAGHDTTLVEETAQAQTKHFQKTGESHLVVSEQEENLGDVGGGDRIGGRRKTWEEDRALKGFQEDENVERDGALEENRRLEGVQEDENVERHAIGAMDENRALEGFQQEDENVEREVIDAPEDDRAAESDSATIPETDTTTVFTLEDLTNPLIWRQLDVKPNERETLLTDRTFVSVFGMDKEGFQKLPRWRRDALKKQKHLF